jgi:myo-inositol-1(or 4)-monophosphatase
MSEELLALARDVAIEAGGTAVRMRREGVSVAGTKSSVIDVVTEADRAVEDLARRRIQEARPGDGFVGEEGDDVASHSGVRWIVDPIDGTVNYLYDRTTYAVSVAAEVGGVVEAAVVFRPLAGDLYAARRGHGATCNGEPLRVREQVPLAESLIATGFNYEQPVRAVQAGAVARMLPQVRDIRRTGSCALDLCAVAAGRLDGYVEEGPEIWDDAAGGLIATEAGARVQIRPGASGKRLVVCAPHHSFDRLTMLVESCGFTREQPADAVR